MGADARETGHRLAGALVEAYNAKDPDAYSALLADDVHYWSVIAGNLEGVDVVMDEVRRLFDILADEQLTVLRQATDGENVVAELAARGTAPAGESYIHEFAHVIGIVDGRVRSLKVYVDPEAVAGLA